MPRLQRPRTRGPPLRVVVPPSLVRFLNPTIAVFEAVLAPGDQRLSQKQLWAAISACQATLLQFLVTQFPDIATCPKVAKHQLLPGAAKNSWFGLRFRVVCTAAQMAQLLTLAGDDRFLELGKVGCSTEPLRMLLRPQHPEQPAQPAEPQQPRQLWLRLDNLPPGVCELSLERLALLLSSCGLEVCAKHPVYRSSQATPAADSLVVVAKTSAPLDGRGDLTFAGISERRGDVRAWYTVHKYPPLPTVASMQPQARAAAAPAPTASATAAAAAPASRQPASFAAAVRAPGNAPMPRASAVAQQQPAPFSTSSQQSAQPAPAHAGTAAPSHGAAPPRASAPASAAPGMHAAQLPAAHRAAPITAAAPQGAVSAVAQATAAAPSAGRVPAAVAFNAAPSPVPASAAAVGAPTAAAGTALAGPSSSAPAPRGGSAFSFKFDGGKTRATKQQLATKHARPPQQDTSPTGAATEDIGVAPAKRRELAAPAQSGPVEVEMDAVP